MPAIRIRIPFAATFAVLLLAAGYLGLAENTIPSYGHSDKGLHFVTFFLLTLHFYWILDTSRRRIIHLTLLVCTAGLSIGSEFLQAIVRNGRAFDPLDILANVVGSGLALALCSWYHKRMLERRRKNKHYDLVPGEDDDLGSEERDVELGETIPGQETGVIVVDVNDTSVDHAANTDVTEELDNWDENEEDWDDPDAAAAKGEDSQGVDDIGASKKRAE